MVPLYAFEYHYIEMNNIFLQVIILNSIVLIFDIKADHTLMYKIRKIIYIIKSKSYKVSHLIEWKSLFLQQDFGRIYIFVLYNI